MLNPLFDIDRLTAAIEAGSLILTPNLRLARKIREAWDRHCLTRGDASWPAADVYPLHTWLDTCWLELMDGAWPAALEGMAAQPLQEQWLWQRVLEADEIVGNNSRGFVELAQRGWQLIREWQLPVEELAEGDHQGARMLVRWGMSWQQQMADHGLLDSIRRAQILRDALANQALPVRSHICLVVFQSLSPLHQEILNLAGHQLENISPPASAPIPVAVSAADPEQEIAAAARWALACAQQHPQSRIGVVIPDLTALRAKVERIFLHHFDPAWCWPGQPYRPLPFNISAATPLADQPLVAAALDLLALNHRRVPIDHLTRIVNCPLWGDASREGPLREAALLKLLESGLAETPVHFLRTTLTSTTSSATIEAGHDSPGTRLTRLADSLRQQTARCSFAEWRQRFERQLTILGWPGQRPLDSLEYQVHEHWLDTLDKLASLDKVASPASATEALQQLRELAADTPFQAETPDAQVQILGTLEAAGLQFDHLWVLQMDDRHWPGATRPHPLLPVDLQRSLDMPHATPARELAMGRELFSLFANSGGEVVFSHARQDGDIDVQASALLADLDITPLEVEDPCHIWTSQISSDAQLELVDDTHGPALALPDPPATTAIRRAGSLLAAQATCPFNAFARFRLGAEPLPSPVIGIGPLARGNLLHYSLEALWRQLPDQQSLQSLGDEGRHRHLTTAIDAAFADFVRRLPLAGELSERHLALEKARIATLVDHWLAWELDRQPFIVEGLELDATLDVAGLGIRLRIDRLDRQGDNGLIIIDYKTGSASLGGLTGDRLLSPQLALYALAVGTPLAAVGYGKISNKGVGFEGLASSDTTLPGARSLAALKLPDGWQETLEKWHNQLNELKEEIVDGVAPVVFFSREAAAYSGDLEPLNRWQGRERLTRFKAAVGGHQ